MKRNLILSALPILVVAMLYTGCTGEGLKYLYSTPSVTPYSFQNNSNNSLVTENGSVDIDKLTFEIIFQYQTIKTASLSLPGNHAYALSVPEPVPTPLEKITSIAIRPLTDYNANYPALSNMTEKCSFHYSITAGDTVTLADVIYNLNNPDYAPHSATYMRMSEMPSDAQSAHRFIVEIITDNNVRLADTTYAIYINP